VRVITNERQPVKVIKGMRCRSKTSVQKRIILRFVVLTLLRPEAVQVAVLANANTSCHALSHAG
jgi:hypothetical protein